MRRVQIFLGLLALVVWVAGLNASRSVSPSPGVVADNAVFLLDEEETDPHYECDPVLWVCLEVEGCGTSVDCNTCVDPCSNCAWRFGDYLDPEEEVPCGGRGGDNWDWFCDCCPIGSSPVILSLHDEIVLSNAERGVPFDLACTGVAQRIPWPVADDDGWLVLDRNGNGIIDNSEELFGDHTLMPNGTHAQNGFLALRVFDENGDGRIDASDAVFSRLRMWRDFSRDGITQPGELVSLAAVGVSSISLDYRLSKKKDRWGNLFRYRAKLHFVSGKETWIYDVILAIE